MTDDIYLDDVIFILKSAAVIYVRRNEKDFLSNLSLLSGYLEGLRQRLIKEQENPKKPTMKARGDGEG